ncbi:hypothetical protein V7152_13235 [Neobacillus drentensis]
MLNLYSNGKNITFENERALSYTTQLLINLFKVNSSKANRFSRYSE